MDLLGLFTTTDTDMEASRILRTIYLPAPFVGLFLERNLTHMEAWTYLCSAIVDAGQEVDFWMILDWLQVASTKKVGNDKSPLALPRPTAPLADRDIIRHLHHMLTRHLPRIDPSLQRVQGLLIVTHTGEVSVEMRRDR